MRRIRLSKGKVYSMLKVVMVLLLVLMLSGTLYLRSKNSDTSPVQSVEPLNTTASTEPVPNQIVLSFKDGTTDQQKQDYIKSIGGTINQDIPNLNSIVVNVPENTTVAESELINKNEPDYYASALDTPNDSRYSEQWSLPVMDVPSTWDSMTAEQKQTEVKVAVIDSGVCTSHSDLAGKIIDGWNFVNNSANAEDDFGHGCSVAGIIGASINNSNGIAGIVPNVKIMPLKVLDSQGMGSYSNVASAIVYATDHGAKIINLSLGGPNPSSLLESAVNYAKAHNVIVVAAAGNTGTSGILYPAKYDYVIAVGSIDSNLQRSSFSTYGDGLDIYAPGRNILTTKINNDYGLVSGTSFAAPQVAGEEALSLITGKPLTLDGKVLAMNGNKEVVAGTATAPVSAPSNTNQVNSLIADPTGYPYAGQSGTDVWAFEKSNCVSYVAWRINKDRGITNTSDTQYFTNNMTGPNGTSGHFGDAVGWKTNAINIGFTDVTTDPKKGDIAYWGANHVAYVERVNPDGTVKVSEYNFGDHPLAYGERDNIRADWYINTHSLNLPTTVVSGTVRYLSNNATVSNAEVTVWNYDTGEIHTTHTSFNGFYLFGNIPLGTEIVSASFNGFTSTSYQGSASAAYGSIVIPDLIIADQCLAQGLSSQSSDVGSLCVSPPANPCLGKDNGKYCGKTLGLDNGKLYKCSNGAFTFVQSCSAGCNIQNPGVDDFCNVGSSSTSLCPNGVNGLYCGSSVNINDGNLYNCQNGVKTLYKSCSFGCQPKPSGTADVCKSAASTGTGVCPVGGNGDYCGATLGLDNTKLYTCTNGSISQKAVCSDGCQQKASGTPDVCYPAGTSAVNNNGVAKFYGDSNMTGNLRLTLPAGKSEEPSKNAVYKSIEIPSGWSIVLHDHPLTEVGNTQCFSSSIPLLESQGGWSTSVESAEIFNTNVCPAANTDSWVKIFSVTGLNPSYQKIVANDIPDLQAAGFGDNTLKSIDFAGNWEAVLYEHPNYQGARVTLSDDNNDLGGLQPFGYGTSSISVRRKQPALFTLYSLGDFNGSSFASDRAIEDLQHWNDNGQSNQNWGDYADSIRVASGYQVIVCKDASYRGSCNRYTSDQANLTNLVNEASSVQVCQGTCPAAATRPTLSTPEDGSNFLPGTNVVLNWIGDADSYDIVYWGGDLTGNLSDYVKNGGNVVTRTGLPGSANPYYWHVKGYNAYGESDWSPTYSFKVQDIAPSYTYISGPNETILSTDQVYTALVSPSDAGNLTYAWTPSPKSGQGTAAATYNFNTPSNQNISVVVTNTGGTSNAQSAVTVGCATGKYLSEYYNGTSLSGTALAYACEDTIDNSWGAGGPTVVPSTAFKIGDGRDGVLNVDAGQTIYTDNVRAKISSAAASSQNILCVSSSSGFAVNDQVLIVQSQGAGVGNNEFGTISAISGCGFTLQNNLTNAYTTSGQVIKVPQYTNVNVTGTLTVHPWDGNTGGVMAFRSMSSVHLNGGTIDASGTGYRGPARTFGAAATGRQGEGVNGTGGVNRAPNEPGGGGAGPGTNDGGSGAGGGSYRTAGGTASDPFYGDPGIGSSTTYGANNLNQLFFGGAGGSGGTDDSAWDGATFGGRGGNGGGIIYIEANSVDGTGNIISKGQNGEDHNNNQDSEHGGGGGGAGGSIKIVSDKVNTDSITISTAGGNGGKAKDGYAGWGGLGEIYTQYCSKLGANTLVGDSQQLTTCDKDNFSARWTSNVNVTTAGTFKFSSWSDDGNKVWVDGVLLVDRWVSQDGATPYSGNKSLTVGVHQVKMEYYESTGTAKAKLTIEQIASNTTPVVTQIPTQTITQGTNFSTINLSTYGSDADTGDTLTWSYSGNTNVNVSIASNVATLTYPSNWTGTENITFKATDGSAAFASSTAAFSVNADSCVGQFSAQYFNNTSLTGTPVLTRCEQFVDNYWNAQSPDASVNVDNFSARWTGNITFAAGNYTFHTSSDNGIKVWVDNNIVIDNWVSHSWENNDFDLTLTAGTHNIKVEYYETTGDAVAALTWYWYGGNCNTIPTGLYCVEFFNNNNLTGSPTFVSLKKSIDYWWDIWGPGHGLTNDDSFSVRWTGNYNFNAGIYWIGQGSDDGIKTWIDNQLVIDDWGPHSYHESGANVNLTAGLHTVKGEFREMGGTATAWQAFAVGTNSTPGVSQIPGQTITTGAAFTTINLNSYGSDWDINDPLTWTYSGNTNVTVSIASNVATLTYPANWTGTENITFKATDPHGAYATSTAAFVVNAAAQTGTELLSAPWHLTGNNGASELYQTIPQTVLQGKVTMRITYDLHGITALGGDASAIIFDQNGWQFVSLSNYGINGKNGSQTVDIPLSAFTGLNLTTGSTTVHTRFWYGSAFTVDITSILLLSAGGPNNPPTITSTPVTSVNENAAYSYDVNATDPESGTLTYSLTQGKSGMTINSSTGVISWTPSYTDSGTYTIIAAVSDGVNTVSQSYSLTVNNVNRTPVVTQIPGQTKTTGQTFSTINLATYGSDPDGDTLTWTYSGNTNITVSIASNVATLTFAPVWTGTENITFKATDTNAAFATSTAAFVVNAPTNHAPTVTQIPGQTIVTGQTFVTINLATYGSDSDAGDSITWTKSGNSNITVSIASNVATLTFAPAWTGTENITFTATDTHSAAASSTAAFTVNAAPTCVFTAQYFNNKTLTGTPVLTRCENDISYIWYDNSPAPGVNADNFSVRWTGNVTFTAATYNFVTESDNGIRLWVDNVQKINNWTSHSPVYNNASVALTAGSHAIKVEYFEATGDARAVVSWLLPQTQTSNCAVVGKFCAKYFNNTTLTGTPVLSLLEPDIDHDWGTSAPGGGVNADNHSARWEGQFNFDAGTYEFGTASDDGVRVWIDGVLKIDNWVAHGYEEDYSDVTLTAGLHTVKMEYYEGGGNAMAAIWWDLI